MAPYDQRGGILWEHCLYFVKTKRMLELHEACCILSNVLLPVLGKISITSGSTRIDPYL